METNIFYYFSAQQANIVTAPRLRHDRLLPNTVQIILRPIVDAV